MTAPHPAVLVTLAGQVVDPIPVDLTVGTWTCPHCRCILAVDLGPLDADDWLDALTHECHPGEDQ